MRAETGETDLRGGFPETRASAVAGVRSADGEVRHRSHATIVTVYWKPVYKYLRLRWGESHEAAQDLTQEFFARAIEKSFFAGFDPGKARFRTFLRTCVDALVANERQASQRLKRGGGVVTFSLDFEGAEAEIDRLGAPDSTSLDAVFDREWVRSLFSTAVDELRAQCESSGRSIVFDLFSKYDLEGDSNITYEELGRPIGLSASMVTNHLAAARRDFRRIVLEKLRDMTASEEEYRLEARALFRKPEPGTPC
jgi:RNA polymerase sigma factor (sigma-70 family)